FNGWYTEASWTVTGEYRKYKNGKFYKLDPKQNFSLKNGTWGAWELATRYAEADLNSGNITGGQMSQLTVALNWYLNSNFRFMADYNKSLDLSGSPVKTTTGQDPNVDTFMLRGVGLLICHVSSWILSRAGLSRHGFFALRCAVLALFVQI
ncbi:MAG: porin, partial [Methylomonas sp.]|nr:porin [Methylomonas sp.]